MQVEASKRFYKDVEDLSADVQKGIFELIQIAKAAEQLYELPNLRKLKGYKNAYRVKIGTYRVGLLTLDENNIISFERCLHRKDIYKYFPK